MTTISRTEPLEHATKERREPYYPTADDYDSETALPIADKTFDPGEDIDPATLPHRPIRTVPVAMETRKLAVVDYGQQALQVTLDGSGNGQVDFGIIPPNQWWMIDNIIGSAAAAGNIVLYERGQVGVVNPMDLVYAKTLNAPAFVVSDYPNGTVLRPGAHVIGGFFGCGNGAVATHKIMYRVCVMYPGREDVER